MVIKILYDWTGKGRLNKNWSKLYHGEWVSINKPIVHFYPHRFSLEDLGQRDLHDHRSQMGLLKY